MEFTGDGDNQGTAQAPERGIVQGLPPVVFVLSVQHTGTWTTIAYLMEHEEFDGFQQLWRWGESHTVGLSEVNIQEQPGECTVIHKHLGPWDVPWSRAMSHYFPVLIPIRDPLAGLITKQLRTPEKYPHMGYFRCWDAAPKAHGYKFPIEQADWAKISQVCGVEPIEPPAVQNETWRHWLHEAYQNQDVAALREYLGESWTQLRHREETFRPFLEALGYEDLMWWSH